MITAKIEYLLLILIDLAKDRSAGYVLSRDVAERQGIPPKYMPQLMSLLTRKGWVTSLRGAKGGVRLVADPGDITVRDIIDVAGEPFLIKPCIDEKHACLRKDRCPLYPIWTQAQAGVDRVMQSTTLADLMEREKDEKGGHDDVKS